MMKHRLIHVLLALAFIAPLGLSACQTHDPSGSGDEHAGEEAGGDEHAGEDAE